MIKQSHSSRYLALGDLQDLVRQMYVDRGFDKSGPQSLALGVCEEAGEIARAVLITVSPDFTPSPKKLSPEWADARNVGEEVGDCIVYLLALCNRLGIEPTFKFIERGWTWKADNND